MVVKNQDYIIDITGSTHEGSGVGKVDGFTIFVEGALPNEKVKIKAIKVNKNFAYGKLLEIMTPSPNRATPFCPIYKACGGCTMQHMSYKEQLSFKTNVVKDNLERIGKCRNVVVHDAIGMEDPYNYRNKVQFPVGTDNSVPVIGFYSQRSHRIVETPTCRIQHDIGDRIREKVKELIVKYKLTTYNEESGKGLLRHLMVRSSKKSGQVMVVFVINGRKLPNSKAIVEELTEEFPEIASIAVNINENKTNVILGNESITLYGTDQIQDYIGDLSFKISPLSFYQVNPVQTEVLYGKALEYASLTGNETVFDLYCGIGTITLFLARKAKKVYGVEVVEAAIEDARENAVNNGIDNAEFFVGEAEIVIPKLYKEGITADVVVVDPPRKGCDERLLETLVDMAPKRLVYVSCNPSTLARDLNYLEAHGFVAVEAQPVDMFPWTSHVESVVLMTTLETS
jgi:23S rRNA (uracil1939-C5)-methyltransferase